LQKTINKNTVYTSALNISKAEVLCVLKADLIFCAFNIKQVASIKKFNEQLNLPSSLPGYIHLTKRMN